MLGRIVEAENTHYRPNAGDMLFKYGLSAAAFYGINKLMDRRIPVKGLTFDRLRYLQHYTIGGKSLKSILGNPQFVNGRMVALNAIKMAEEQLFRFPRTFSASSYYAEKLLHGVEVNVRPQDIKGQEAFLYKVSGGKISRSEIAKGLIIRNGQVLDSTGQNVLLRKSVISPNWGVSHDLHTNASNIRSGRAKLAYISGMNRATYEMYGFTPPKNDFYILGSNKSFGLIRQKANALFTDSIKGYVKLLDDPFELLSSTLDRELGRKTKFSRTLGKASGILDKLMLRNMFGVGGFSEMKNSSGIELLAKHAKRGLPALALGVFAYKTVDEILRNTPVLNDTILGGGISGTAAKMYQEATKFGARISDATGLTALSDYQEKLAPGSTSLLGLAAIPASFAIAAGTYAGITKEVMGGPIGMKMPAPKGFIEGAERLGNALHIPGLDTFAKNRSRTGAFAITAALAGTALVLPFLPGALGSDKSSEELQDIYSGRQQVAVRRGQMWEFGSTSIQGEDIEYYVPHWTVQSITDARKKGILPKDEYGSPISRMLKTVFDPYYLEKRLDKERPYTFWGPTDYGLGLVEKIAQPVKNIFKPTIVAHPEALGYEDITRGGLPSNAAPDSLGSSQDAVSTYGFKPEIQDPRNLKVYGQNVTDSFLESIGMKGFVFRAINEAITGRPELFNPESVHETSGRIMSQSRNFWDRSLGGLGGLSEFYRRINPNRDYETEYVGSPIRNTMPDWMPRQYLTGDPYIKVKLGELRLPGRGFESLHPELKGVDPADYPAIHRLKILSDVAPYSPEYNRAMSEVQYLIGQDALPDDAMDIYDEVLRQQKEIDMEPYEKYDYGDGALGGYWLGLKKFGRSLPTESLFPLSPVHKFAGPVDPLSEFKSKVVLDSQFKQWENPVQDYLRPAVNKAMDIATMGNFVPDRYQDYVDTEQYFDRLQFVKNQILEQKAQRYADAGDFEAASYMQSGKRKTLFGSDITEDREMIGLKMPQKMQDYFLAFADQDNQEYRNEILKYAPSDMQEVLQSQWRTTDLMHQGDFARIEAIKKNAQPVGGGAENINYLDMPSNDFIGYAPGVNLNAFKVKVVNNMGKNVRDHNLWKEDERQAVILDSILDGNNTPSMNFERLSINRDNAKRQLEQYARQMGMRGVDITATPITGRSIVDVRGKSHLDGIRDQMREDNLIRT